MAAIDQMRRYPLRVLKTLLLYLNYLALGLSLGVPGPTLLDLQILVQASVSEISFVLPGRAGGFAIGSLLGETLYCQMLYEISTLTLTFFVSQLASSIQESMCNYS